jgi:aryl-alcohol dehydrogenase-like predicted oxidoreductase
MSLPKLAIAGVDRPVSRFILGCDNKDTAAEGAPLWDHWLEAGGNAFDTAFVYGGGRHEKALGDWIRLRGLAQEAIVIAKGAHTPHCTPEAIAAQLAQSLERLQLESVPIYIMHRDNPDVPAGEFVSALNDLRGKGLIGIFGGSNWSVLRFEEARRFAAANGLQPLTILNNNLSLAVMERPVWAGCISSNSSGDLDYLRRTDTIHLSWSSQARGYFLPPDLRDRLPVDTRPETCFGSTANAERRRRAEDLAARRGVTANNIAAAWVLCQPFPSFALIGPRSVGEIDSSLPGAVVNLSAEDVAWLNLEA